MARFLFPAISAALLCTALAGCEQPTTQMKQIVDMNKPAPRCFSVADQRTWRAPDAKTMYVRVWPRDYYRLDLVGACSALTWPDSFLIQTFRGTSTVCSHLDWDLKVSQSGGGIPVPCMVEKMTPLTPAQVAAIPEKDRP
jgi:hypothetical protein